MHTALVLLVLSLWTALGVHGPDQARIADAIASAVEAETSPASGESHAVDVSLLAYYAAKESGLSEHPRAWSWDARAGLSSGVWQLRSYLVTGHTLEYQARAWLGALRARGLAAGIDSSPSRARARLAKARAVLSSVLAIDSEIAAAP